MCARKMKIAKFAIDKPGSDKVKPIQCDTCRFRADGLKCRAYPRGIPHAILSGRHDHRKPYLDDRGFLYEPDE